MTVTVLDTTHESGLNLDVIESNPALQKSLDNFLAFASHRIQEQALPHFMDGLVPGQRKLLLAAQDKGALSKSKHVKSTSIVSQSASDYHPVGDTYDVLVNMSQHFRVQAMLTDPEGNWGEPENFRAAASRYTEIRFSRFGEEVLLQDLPSKRVSTDYEPHGIVPCDPTYTDLLWEERYFPARLPLLLLNGSNGIAVGIAQTFQPLAFKTVIECVRSFINTGEMPADPAVYAMGYPANPTILTPPSELRDILLNPGGRSIRTAATINWVTKGNAILAIELTAVPPSLKYNDLGDAFAKWRRESVDCPFSEFANETSEDRGTSLVFKIRTRNQPKTKAEQQALALALFRGLPQLVSSQTVNMVALKDRFPVNYNLQTLIADWVAERAAIIQRVAVKELERLEQDWRRQVLLLWAAKNLEQVSQIVKQAENELAADDLFHNLWINTRHAVHESLDNLGFMNWTAVDTKAVLEFNLRQLSRFNSDEALKRLRNLNSKLAENRELRDSRAARNNAILTDLTYFETNAEKFGLRTKPNKYDANLAALLNTRSTKPAIKLATVDGKPAPAKAAPSGLNWFQQNLLASEQISAVTLSREGTLKVLPFRNLRKAPTTLDYLNKDDQLEHAILHHTTHLFGITGTGQIFKLAHADLPEPGKFLYLSSMGKRAGREWFDKGWTPIAVTSMTPTHLLVVHETCYRKIPLKDFSSDRVSVALPDRAKIVGAALINDKDPLFLSNGTEVHKQFVHSTKATSRKQTHYLPMRQPLLPMQHPQALPQGGYHLGFNIATSAVFKLDK